MGDCCSEFALYASICARPLQARDMTALLLVPVEHAPARCPNAIYYTMDTIMLALPLASGSALDTVDATCTVHDAARSPVLETLYKAGT